MTSCRLQSNYSWRASSVTSRLSCVCAAFEYVADSEEATLSQSESVRSICSVDDVEFRSKTQQFFEGMALLRQDMEAERYTVSQSFYPRRRVSDNVTHRTNVLLTLDSPAERQPGGAEFANRLLVPGVARAPDRRRSAGSASRELEQLLRPDRAERSWSMTSTPSTMRRPSSRQSESEESISMVDVTWRHRKPRRQRPRSKHWEETVAETFSVVRTGKLKPEKANEETVRRREVERLQENARRDEIANQLAVVERRERKIKEELETQQKMLQQLTAARQQETERERIQDFVRQQELLREQEAIRKREITRMSELQKQHEIAKQLAFRHLRTKVEQAAEVEKVSKRKMESQDETSFISIDISSPVTYVTSVTTVTPVTSVTLVTPVTPVTAVTTVTPVTNVTPVASVTPVTSVTTVTTVTPVTSVTTVTPATSVTPVKSELQMSIEAPVTSVESVELPAAEDKPHKLEMVGERTVELPVLSEVESAEMRSVRSGVVTAMDDELPNTVTFSSAVFTKATASQDALVSPADESIRTVLPPSERPATLVPEDGATVSVAKEIIHSEEQATEILTSADLRVVEPVEESFEATLVQAAGAQPVRHSQSSEDDVFYDASDVGDAAEAGEHLMPAAGSLLMAPVFELPLADVTAFDGSGAILECRVTGNPAPEVMWFVNGVEIRSVPPEVTVSYHAGLCRLVIVDVMPDDEGEYTVRAINEAGSCLTSAYLTVLRKSTCSS